MSSNEKTNSKQNTRNDGISFMFAKHFLKMIYICYYPEKKNKYKGYECLCTNLTSLKPVNERLLQSYVYSFCV